MSGHLFVVRGDVTHLACDAILIPSGLAGDRPGYVSRAVWRDVLGDLVDSDDFVRPAPDEQTRVREVRPANGIQRPALWVGHTGKSNADPTWYAAAVEQFIRGCSACHEAGGPRPLDDRRPLLGIPLVGTGDGGARNRRGEVLLEIMRAIERAIDSVDADVALVLNHAEGFSAAQQARRHIFGDNAWRELTDEHQDVARRLAERARNRNLVVFVGAGASIGAGLPSWKGLLQTLADTAELDPAEAKQLAALDARDAGAVLERRLNGKKQLAGAICRLVDTDRVSLLHQLLVSAPINEAVTTNYDRCLETAYEDAGKPIRVLPHESVGGADRWLVKLHGSPEDQDRIVLSRDDYLRFEGEGAALSGIVQALLLTRHMLFVGYSLSDDNFHRIVHQVRSVIGGRPDRPESSAFATALSPIPGGLLDEIWKGEVDYVSTAGPDGDDPRRIAIILDLIAADAAPPAGHLLDESYLPMFTADEQKLRKELLEVWNVIDDPLTTVPQPVRDAVRDALELIGRSAREPGERIPYSPRGL